MAADTKKLSMYLAGTLKVLFDGATNAITHTGGTYTIVSYEGHDLIDRSRKNGTLDEMELCKNIGKIVDCAPSMKDRLFDDFTNEKVSFVAMEVVGASANEKGNYTNRCYFITDSYDKEKVDRILNKLNRADLGKEMDPKQFLSYCEKGEIKISGIVGVEPEIMDIIRNEKTFDFPYCAIENSNGYYNIRMPSAYEDKARDAITQALVLCSGRTRDAIIESKRERQKELADALAKVMDSKKSFIIMDANAPDHYIRTNSEGFVCCIQDAGDKEPKITAQIERLDPHYEDKAYMFLHEYGKPESISLADKDVDKQMEAIRKGVVSEKEADISVKLEMYKRSFKDYIQEAIEQDYLGRLKDNQVRFGNAIAHAVIQKDDTSKGDLESDAALNRRATEGFVKESSIDLSDLNGDSFKEKFCEQVLGLGAIENETEREFKEEEIKGRISELSDLEQEPPEIKLAVINEIKQTIEEVRTIDYTIETVERDELVHDLESRDSLTIEINDEDHEY